MSTPIDPNSLPSHITLDLLKRLESQPPSLCDNNFTDFCRINSRGKWPLHDIPIFHPFFEASFQGLDRGEVSGRFSRPNCWRPLTLFIIENGLCRPCDIVFVQILLQAMRLCTEYLTSGLPEHGMATDTMGTMMQWLVPEVVRLVKSPALFEQVCLYRHFVQEAVFCLENLKSATNTLDLTTSATTNLKDLTRLRKNWDCRSVYGFSEDDFERPWNYFLLNQPLLFHYRDTMHLTTVGAHGLMSGGVRLAHMWEHYARLAHNALRAVSQSY